MGKNVVVAQSGGPTCVINNSLRGIVETCRAYPEKFRTVYGGWHGVEGILQEELLARVRTGLRVHRLHSRLEEVSYTDSLTGLRNRRYYDQRLQEEVARCRRYFSALSLILIDLDLSRVSQPVLLLWGEGDRWTDLRLARWLADELPDARLQVIDRARHMVLEERAEEANEAILAFLCGGST